jgi:hypothetical protein
MKKKKNKSKPVQRSLAILRDNGWSVAIVEKWIPPRGQMKFGIRLDVWGFGDLLACRPKVWRDCEPCRGTGKRFQQGRRYMQTCEACKGVGREVLAESSIALVQCCRDGDFAEHKDKILAINEFYTWKAAGGLVFLQGWSLKGPRGQKKHWQMREEEL